MTRLFKKNIVSKEYHIYYEKLFLIYLSKASSLLYFPIICKRITTPT